MAMIDLSVQELSEDLKIQDSVIVYAESQMGPQRNQRYMQTLARVRLGLQTSPEELLLRRDRLCRCSVRESQRS